MDWNSFLQAIRRESDALATAASLGLDPAVPSCPGWIVRDVVEHTGFVHRHKEQIVQEPWMDAAPDPIDPPSEGLIQWFLSGSETLVTTLANTEPTLPVYSWYEPDQSVGFWYRRMAHETAIHRVDAELGHGIVNPIESRLAADGVDEILTVMMEGSPGGRSPRRPIKPSGLSAPTSRGHGRCGSSPGPAPVANREPNTVTNRGLSSSL